MAALGITLPVWSRTVPFNCDWAIETCASARRLNAKNKIARTTREKNRERIITFLLGESEFVKRASVRTEMLRKKPDVKFGSHPFCTVVTQCQDGNGK